MLRRHKRITLVYNEETVQCIFLFYCLVCFVCLFRSSLSLRCLLSLLHCDVSLCRGFVTTELVSCILYLSRRKNYVNGTDTGCAGYRRVERTV